MFVLRFQPYLRQGLLFIALYPRLLDFRVSGDSPAFASNVSIGMLGLWTHATESDFKLVLGI